MSKLDNTEINKEGNYVLISINPKIYPLDVVYGASYVLMDKAYILIDGDPDEEILIELSPKDKKAELDILAKEFNEELLNYAAYKTQAEKNKDIKRMILQRVLLTNINPEEEKKEEYKKDPEGILKPYKKDE
jgi:His-Xaa-Ser system protein HxsD